VKRPFRFHRGEFNSGVYLSALLKAPNICVQDIIDEIVYQIRFQWKLEGETGRGEDAIREEDIYNIGRLAGVFQLLYSGDINLGSLWFTKSHIVNGVQRSERGLVDMPDEVFKFVRVDRDNYSDDIVNEASKDLRISVVPSGTVPVGYVRYDTPLYREDGTVIQENILPDPPEDGTPYVPFYGEKFLVHEHLYKGMTPLNIIIFKALFESFMYVRYNGPSIQALLTITRLIGEGYIYDLDIEPNGLYCTCYYKLNDEIDIRYRTWRLFAWKNICERKFKHFIMVQQI
jgi:hypothetical protein